MLLRLVSIVALLSAAACDDAVRRQAAPAGPSDPPAQTVSYAVWIVSGEDGSPVRDATVVIEGRTYRSDDDGTVTVAPRFSSLAIDVDAAGFLPRRTTSAVNQSIAMWPVASQAEAQAVRQMVYERGGRSDGILLPPDPGPFYVSMADPAFDREGVLRAWAEEAKAFGATFGLAYQFPGSFQYETNEIAVAFDHGSGARCTPGAALGFCRDPNLNYKTFVVAAAKAADPLTIRRVLASWFLGPNPLPGLLNREAPADAMSPLEMQTIRMILRRTLRNRWPDDDRW